MSAYPDPPNPFNGWGRLVGLVGIPGLISLYMVWWMTQGISARLDRVIQLLEQIARSLKVAGV
jgi:hypothetical protein